MAQVSFWTGANDSPIVPIEPGMLVWERLQLSDGTLARLVTSILRGRGPLARSLMRAWRPALPTNILFVG